MGRRFQFEIHICGGLILNPLANRRKKRWHSQREFQSFHAYLEKVISMPVVGKYAIFYIKGNMIQHHMGFGFRYLQSQKGVANKCPTET